MQYLITTTLLFQSTLALAVVISWFLSYLPAFLVVGLVVLPALLGALTYIWSKQNNKRDCYFLVHATFTFAMSAFFGELIVYYLFFYHFLKFSPSAFRVNANDHISKFKGVDIFNFLPNCGTASALGYKGVNFGSTKFSGNANSGRRLKGSGGGGGGHSSSGGHSTSGKSSSSKGKSSSSSYSNSRFSGYSHAVAVSTMYNSRSRASSNRKKNNYYCIAPITNTTIVTAGQNLTVNTKTTVAPTFWAVHISTSPCILPNCQTGCSGIRLLDLSKTESQALQSAVSTVATAYPYVFSIPQMNDGSPGLIFISVTDELALIIEYYYSGFVALLAVGNIVFVLWNLLFWIFSKYKRVKTYPNAS